MTKSKDLYNSSDKFIWNKVFANIPNEWTQSEVSPAMTDCQAFFKKNNVQNVLDLGCGIGIWAVFLTKSGFAVKAIDFSENAIKFAKEWAENEELVINYECSPLLDYSYNKEHFDGIVAAKVLDNISKTELENVKTQIQSNLKTGGILFCLFNPYMSTAEIEKLKRSDNPTKGITHIVFDDDEIKQLFPDMTLLDFKHYKYGFRGVWFRKK